MEAAEWAKRKEQIRQSALRGPDSPARGSGLIVPVDAAVQRRMDASLRAGLGLMFGQPREIVTVAAMALFMGCVKAAPARMGRVVETVEAGATSES